MDAIRKELIQLVAHRERLTVSRSAFHRVLFGLIGRNFVFFVAREQLVGIIKLVVKEIAGAQIAVGAHSEVRHGIADLRIASGALQNT